MPTFPYLRRPAPIDSVVICNGNASWDITKPADPVNDPTKLWLRIPDNAEEGGQRLMQYDWDLDIWSDVTPG